MSKLFARLFHLLARFLSAFTPDPAAGAALQPSRDPFTVDDGVDYSLPLVIPDWVSPEQKTEIVRQHLSEAASVYHFQFDRPYLYSENLSQFPTEDPLREWDFTTRKAILARCHLAYKRNPLAKTSIQYTTMFSVGEGFTINYYNDRVKEILEAFRNDPDNAVQKYEKSFCDDLQIDGELFVRFHKADDGRTVITAIRPWEIDWIETEMGMARRVKSYHQMGQQTTGKPGEVEFLDEIIPADEVLHISINDASYETRGTPDLFVNLPWLKAYKDWLEGRARENHWRGAVFGHISLENATPAQVASKRAQYRQPPPPGSWFITNEKEKVELLDSKINAGSVAEDGRQIKLMAAVGAKMPEYMLSDGSNANLASSKSQALPALRKFTDFQDILVSQVWIPIYDRVLQNAIAGGTLTEEVIEQDADGDTVFEDDGTTPKTVKALEAYDLSAPELETDEPKTLADALTVATANEWVSDETAAGRMGFDYGIEKKKIDRAKEASVQAAMQGRAMLPAAPPVSGEPQPQPPAPPQEQPAPTPPQLPEAFSNYLARLEQLNGDNHKPVVVNIIPDTEKAEAEQKRLAEAESHAENERAELKRLTQSVAGQLPALFEVVTISRAEGLAIRSDMASMGDQLADLKEQVQAAASAPTPAPVVDARLIRQIAQETATLTARETAQALSVVSQEIAGRDAQGRASAVRRVLANGTVETFDVLRDGSGNITGLSRR